MSQLLVKQEQQKAKSQYNNYLTSYRYKHCPTELSGGGILFCTVEIIFHERYEYKTRNDLNIYKSAELESTCIEINHKNILVDDIYMDLNYFDGYYHNELLGKLSSENKSVILLGDFNVDF